MQLIQQRTVQPGGSVELDSIATTFDLLGQSLPVDGSPAIGLVTDGSVVDRLLSLPATVPTLLALAIVVGLVLWLMGRRFGKPSALGAGGLCGATLGLCILPWSASFGLDPMLTVGLGAAIGATAGLLLNRVLNIASMGLVGAATLAVLAVAVLWVRPLNDARGSAVTEQGEAWQSQLTSWQTQAVEASRSVPLPITAVSGSLLNRPEAVAWGDRLGRASETLANRAERASGTMTEAWRRQPNAHRAVLVMSAILGLSAGLVFGLMRPAAASAASTSMFGSALWLFGVTAMSGWLSAPWSAWLNRTDGQWIAAWSIIAVLGMIVQWSGVLKRCRDGGAKTRRSTEPSPA